MDGVTYHPNGYVETWNKTYKVKYFDTQLNKMTEKTYSNKRDAVDFVNSLYDSNIPELIEDILYISRRRSK